MELFWPPLHFLQDRTRSHIISDPHGCESRHWWMTDGIGSAAGSASEGTSLAALSSSAAATRVLENVLEDPIPSKNHIAIIVQTNFQVCAYTTSSLHVSMLGLFAT